MEDETRMGRRPSSRSGTSRTTMMEEEYDEEVDEEEEMNTLRELGLGGKIRPYKRKSSPRTAVDHQEEEDINGEGKKANIRLRLPRIPGSRSLLKKRAASAVGSAVDTENDDDHDMITIDEDEENETNDEEVNDIINVNTQQQPPQKQVTPKELPPAAVVDTPSDDNEDKVSPIVQELEEQLSTLQNRLHAVEKERDTINSEHEMASQHMKQ
eukprot:5216798-Ditylum_brightwellii.AAC.1